jgi:hypothetical protein
VYIDPRTGERLSPGSREAVKILSQGLYKN